jgi:hypothetical protein
MSELKVFAAPSKLPEDGRIARGVQFADGSGRIELWTGMSWEPDELVTMLDLFDATKLSDAELDVAGITAADRPA